jgi:phosphoribosylanthranilate isomerase
LLVGVFVDQGVDFVSRALSEVGLDLAQLHGDETAEDYDALAARAVKAFRLGDRFDPAVAAPFADCWGYLLDAARPGLYGGTGEPWRWESAAGALPGRRLLLAGGVAPGRVAALATAWRRRTGGELPWGIDVCSGVESAPGIKDAARLRALFAEVRDVEIAHVA